MQFEGTITLGTIISLAVLIAGILAMFVRLGTIKQTIEGHSAALKRGTDRMDQHDKLLLALVGDLREWIGRSRQTQRDDMA